MNPAALSLCLCLSLNVGAAAPPPDRWLAEDKLKHFFASFAATTLASGAARAAGLDALDSARAGAGFGLGAGLWKELRDVRRGDPFSYRDLAWDVAGVGAAVAVVRQAR